MEDYGRYGLRPWGCQKNDNVVIVIVVVVVMVDDGYYKRQANILQNDIIDIAKPFTLMKIKLASDGDAAIDRLLLLAVVQQKNEEERGGNSNVSNFPPLAISCTLKVS